MMQAGSKTFTLGLAAVGLVASLFGFVDLTKWWNEEARYSSEDCFSLEFNRYKLGKFIIDTPSAVRPSLSWDYQNPKKIKRRDVFVSILNLRDSLSLYKESEKTGKGIVGECQLKISVPYDVGSELNISHAPAFQLRGSELEIYAIVLPEFFDQYPAKSYKRKLRNNLFDVNKIASIQVKSDTVEMFGNPKQTGFNTVFVQNGRDQSINCNVALCSQMAFQDEDGLVYLVSPDRFSWKENISTSDSTDLNNFNIVAAEDLPETVIPILNFAQGLRNKSAEKDIK